LGLHDRGRVAIGHKADLNLIDFERLSIQQPVMTSDLPAGGNRILQLATGYIATIVSSKITYRNGEPTGALGRALGHGFRASTRLNPETLPVCHEAIDPTSAIEIVEKIIWKMNEWNVADSLKL
jgi:N-acyl-D-aspartate/D-glutamate deacylase